MAPIITIDVYAEEAVDLEVTCQAKASSSKLRVDHVTFHGLTDVQYRQIVDAIELYLMRKNLRERERAKFVKSQEEGQPDERREMARPGPDAPE